MNFPKDFPGDKKRMKRTATFNQSENMLAMKCRGAKDKLQVP